MWFAGPQANADKNSIKARALISFTGMLSLTSIELEVGEAIITGVNKMEGRVKESLTYRLENRRLRVELPVEIARKYQIVVEYEINLNNSFLQNYLQHTPDLLVMNPFNARGDLSLGSPGAFYPSLLGDESTLLLNITMFNNESIGFKGNIEFETDNQDGTKTQYWRSEAPVSPEGFYFVIGEFKEFEAEDLEEEFELSAVELRKLRKIRIFNAKKDMLTAIDFLGLNTTALTDSEFAYVDSLSGLKHAGFFITGQELNLGISNRDLNRVKALILYTNQNDTASASRKLDSLFIQKNDKTWEEGLMDWKWERRNTLSQKDQERVMRFRLRRWQNSNPELFAEMTQPEIDTALFNPIIQTFKYPKITVSYRYVAGDTALYVGYLQDTLNSPTFTLPVQVTFITDEGTFSKVKKISGVKGELRVKSAKIPNVASVSFGQHFPGRVEEKKPDTYLLYQLGQAKTIVERKEALLGLFKTNNPNLFSTALGIALRDSDSELRLLALQNADNLNLPAQQKLKSSIELLTQDSSEEISTLAKNLARKYYGAK
tara:strand:- start:251 stop:1885 length:1635 start_codon:yes stop_codon:yes gene_type:complete